MLVGAPYLVRDALLGTVSQPRRELESAVLVPRQVQCQPLAMLRCSSSIVATASLWNSSGYFEGRPLSGASRWTRTSSSMSCLSTGGWSTTEHGP
jgi:hypothetical protein